MLRNKHVIVALLVSPVLAILAWFAVGSMLGETPHSAQPGAAYPLVERSNCRYESGRCDMENEDLQLSLILQSNGEAPVMLMQSSHPLDGVLLAVAASGEDSRPESMRADTLGRDTWSLPLAGLPGDQERLQLVVSANGASWYADVSTRFLEYYQSE